MYQCQSDQISSLRSPYIMTTHHARHHENQMSVLSLSSEIFRRIWSQLTIWRGRWRNNSVKYWSL